MSDFLIPIAQIAISFALLLVAILCLRLDRNLNAMRAGQDGIAQTIGQLNSAVLRADAAIKALREQSTLASGDLQRQIEEATAIADGLKFLTSTARALDTKPRETAPEPKANARWEDDDFRPTRRDTTAAASRWSGLR
jgi:hypothetical protein